MENSLFLPITTAATIGLGCGACCSPVISVFLSSYVLSHAAGIRKAVLSFLCFFFGKLISVSLLCAVAAAVSRQFISPDGYIGGWNLRLAAQLAMSGIGLAMAARWVYERRKPDSCNACRGCGGQQPKSGVLPMLASGLVYGFTPCAPLLMMIGYAFTLPIAFAGLTGGVFALASAVSPLLLLTVISGALSKRLRREIPYCLKWFQLASYLLLASMPFIIVQ